MHLESFTPLFDEDRLRQAAESIRTEAKLDGFGYFYELKISSAALFGLLHLLVEAADEIDHLRSANEHLRREIVILSDRNVELEEDRAELRFDPTIPDNDDDDEFTHCMGSGAKDFPDPCRHCGRSFDEDELEQMRNPQHGVRTI